MSDISPMLGNQHRQPETLPCSAPISAIRVTAGVGGVRSWDVGPRSLTRRVSPNKAVWPGDTSRERRTVSDSVHTRHSGGVRGRGVGGTRLRQSERCRRSEGLVMEREDPITKPCLGQLLAGSRPHTSALVLTQNSFGTRGRRALGTTKEVWQCAGECVLGVA